jgi:hypothetical protein
MCFVLQILLCLSDGMLLYDKSYKKVDIVFNIDQGQSKLLSAGSDLPKLWSLMSCATCFNNSNLVFGYFVGSEFWLPNYNLLSFPGWCHSWWRWYFDTLWVKLVWLWPYSFLSGLFWFARSDITCVWLPWCFCRVSLCDEINIVFLFN